MKMWSSYDKEQIQDYISRSHDAGAELTIWQNINNRKVMHKGKIIKTGESKTEIEVEDSKDLREYPLIKDETLFVHCALEETLFKKDYFLTNARKITVNNPIELKIKDKRLIERFPYKYQDFKNIVFNHECDMESYQKFAMVVLVDISVRGAGFVINESDIDKIKKGEILFVSRITDQDLPEAQRATVKYIKPYSISSDKTGLYKVGLLFDESLDSVSYKSICSIVEKKQEKVRGLEVDGYNGLNPDDQKRILAKIAEENKYLALNLRERIEELDRLRYLTTKMKQDFLLGVNLNVLSAALRLSSKELIFDLFSEVTDTMRNEFLEKLNEPKPPSAVNKAQDEIYKYIKEKEKAGEIVLDASSFEVYV